MSSLGLFAVLLAAGWWFYRRLLLTRYEALHHAGHPQYFGAALCATYLFLVGAAAQELAARWELYRLVIQPVSERILDDLSTKDTPSLTLQAEITGFALVGAWVLSSLFNRPLGSPKLLQTIARKSGALDQLEELAIKCDNEALLCALTLDNGKVYIGIPDQFSWPGIGRDWIALIPVASGYRTEHGQLEITTYYEIKLGGSANHEDPNDRNMFMVVIATAQVRTAQSFDLTTYRAFRTPAAPQIVLPAVTKDRVAEEQYKIDPRPAAPQNALQKGDNRRYLAYIWMLVVLSVALPAALVQTLASVLLFVLAMLLAIYARTYLAEGEN